MIESGTPTFHSLPSAGLDRVCSYPSVHQTDPGVPDRSTPPRGLAEEVDDVRRRRPAPDRGREERPERLAQRHPNRLTHRLAITELEHAILGERLIRRVDAADIAEHEEPAIRGDLEPVLPGHLPA